MDYSITACITNIDKSLTGIGYNGSHTLYNKVQAIAISATPMLRGSDCLRVSVKQLIRQP